MKKILNLAVLAIGLVLSASCGPATVFYQYNSAEGAGLKSQQNGFHVTPVVADLDVRPARVTYSKQFDNELTAADVDNPAASALLKSMKEATLAECALKNGADVLVSPTYEFATSSSYRTVTVTVHGYLADYKNFRTPSEEDLSQIKALDVAVPEAAPQQPGMMGLQIFGKKK